VEKLLRAPRVDCIRVQGGASVESVFDAVQKVVDVYGARIPIIRSDGRYHSGGGSGGIDVAGERLYTVKTF
jgi:hypothetical protein